MVAVVGLSAMFHDAAAAVVVDGQVVAAAQQERFSRIKHDAALPVDALRSCLQLAGLGPNDIDAVAFYEKPLATFGRVIRSLADAGPRAMVRAPKPLASWFSTKLWTSFEIDRAIRELGYRPPRERILFAEHHVSHAAAAFYPSPFESACTLTFDGVGEWATSSIGRGVGRRVDLVEELRFPSSIGLLYSTFTVAAGFRVNGGEYKLMGLAPFGMPSYVDKLLSDVIHLHDDGSFDLDLSYFDFVGGQRMASDRFHAEFGPDRTPDSPITARDCDLACSVQQVVEEIVLRMARHAHAVTGERRAVLAGGVALNGVANGRLLRDGPFDEIWVQPAAGDAGSAVGCALWAHHEVLGHERVVSQPDGMRGAQLGPAPEHREVLAYLRAGDRPGTHLPDPAERAARVAELLAGGAIVAVVQGPMEFDPRALGNRSILADPRSPTAARDLNARVKRREGFRPFAPAVLADRADEWFELPHPSPYMSLVVPVRGAEPEGSSRNDGENVDLADRLDAVASPLPAVTHVDGTARVQTVDAERFGWFHQLLEAFDRQTGCPVLLNTSFNVRGEPIVLDHEDAYRCFMTTDIDWLLLGEVLLAKADQPPWTGAPAALDDD